MAMTSSRKFSSKEMKRSFSNCRREWLFKFPQISLKRHRAQTTCWLSSFWMPRSLRVVDKRWPGKSSKARSNDFLRKCKVQRMVLTIEWEGCLWVLAKRTYKVCRGKISRKQSWRKWYGHKEAVSETSQKLTTKKLDQSWFKQIHQFP